MPRPGLSGGRNCEVGPVVTMLRLTELALTEFPLLGLKLQVVSDGRLLCKQV